MTRAEIVTARLRMMAELSKSGPPRRGIDYGERAVTGRLRDLSDLSRFCTQLAAIGRGASTR